MLRGTYLECREQGLGPRAAPAEPASVLVGSSEEPVQTETSSPSLEPGGCGLPSALSDPEVSGSAILGSVVRGNLVGLSDNGPSEVTSPVWTFPSELSGFAATGLAAGVPSLSQSIIT